MNPELHVSQQYNLLVDKAFSSPSFLRGIYIVPRPSDVFVWDGIIFVRSGLYTKGVFRFQVVFPRVYVPMVHKPLFRFSTEIYHPLVDKDTGEVHSDLVFDPSSQVPDSEKVITFLTDLFSLSNISSAHILNKTAFKQYQSFLIEKDSGKETDDIPFLVHVRFCVVRSMEDATNEIPNCAINCQEILSNEMKSQIVNSLSNTNLKEINWEDYFETLLNVQEILK
ncbi:hypothetical protein RCL1_003355 [Eukaryota sp. TZLM3-RCL]